MHLQVRFNNQTTNMRDLDIYSITTSSSQTRFPADNLEYLTSLLRFLQQHHVSTIAVLEVSSSRDAQSLSNKLSGFLQPSTTSIRISYTPPTNTLTSFKYVRMTSPLSHHLIRTIHSAIQPTSLLFSPAGLPSQLCNALITALQSSPQAR